MQVVVLCPGCGNPLGAKIFKLYGECATREELVAAVGAVRRCCQTTAVSWAVESLKRMVYIQHRARVTVKEGHKQPLSNKLLEHVR